MVSIYVLFYIVGSVIGSFLNVCMIRMPEGRNIAFPPSQCDDCGTPLKWFDMIPVFSYLFYRGKCRYCHAPLSIRYPMVEAFNGLLYVGLYCLYGFSYPFFLLAITLSVLLIIAVVDYETQLIAESLMAILFGVGLLYRILNIFVAKNPWITELKEGGLGLLIGGGILLLILILSKGGMGDGDVFLMGALGLMIGIEKTFLTLFLSFIFGAFISVFLLLFKKKTRKDAIPFGPFIALAFGVTVFFGDSLLKFYYAFW